MSTGKQKCELLKAIRKQIAEHYGLEYNPSECTHEGECLGTCPKCDAELKELQGQLDALGRNDIKLNNDLLSLLDALKKNDEEEDIHILEGDVTPPSDDELITVTMGMPHPPLTYFERKRVLYKECPIAGTTFHNLEEIWDELYEGAELALIRDKDNKHDKNAIAVALADDYDGNAEDYNFDYILGYVPRKENGHLAKMFDMGWSDAFECELSQINGSNPYKGSLIMKIYIVSKEEQEVEQTNHLLRVLELDDDEYEDFKHNLNVMGCSYFRFGGFPPWEHKYPKKGEKVVFMHKEEENTILYLMHCIAVGDDDASYFVEDKDSLFAVDDCCYYVFTNSKGPIKVQNKELGFLVSENINKSEPEYFISEEATSNLKNIIGFE